MRRYFQIAALAVAALVPLMAQSPKGWRVRMDENTNSFDASASGSVKFVVSGSGFRATNPKAAVFWNEKNMVTGNYTLKGTFTLEKLSPHTNYYGLVFGGTNLDGERQRYLYFEIAQNGTWLIKRRQGQSTSDIAPPALSDAIKKPDASGKSTNELEVRVGPEHVSFAVNGQVVHSEDRPGPIGQTDGLYGIRVNHLLEVQIDNLGVTKQ